MPTITLPRLKELNEMLTVEFDELPEISQECILMAGFRQALRNSNTFFKPDIWMSSSKRVVVRLVSLIWLKVCGGVRWLTRFLQMAVVMSWLRPPGLLLLRLFRSAHDFAKDVLGGFVCIFGGPCVMCLR